MYKKILLNLLFCGIASCNAVFAQNVIVEGVGENKREATRDAMRNAVEQVVGTYIDSRTLVDKSVVELDKIYTKSNGYVKDIKILSEQKEDGLFKLTTSVDVDTNPNSALINKISIIMSLNDPIIITDITCNSDKELYRGFKSLCESSINRTLIDMGFNRIVDSTNESNSALDKQCDYIVMGELSFITEPLIIPKFDMPGVNGTSQFLEAEEAGQVLNNDSTGIHRARSIMSVKIVKARTKEIVSQFNVDCSKFSNTESNAEYAAVENISEMVAQRVAEVFSKKAANISSNMQIVARAKDYDLVLDLQKALNSLPEVNAVYIRSYESEKAIIDVDSTQSLNYIYKRLLASNEFGMFLENITENILEISINKTR